MSLRDTIAAIATATGSGGVGIVRLSGSGSIAIAHVITGRVLTPRHAHHVRFVDDAGEVLDDGIAIVFAAPASYTGEDVVELQAHGSPAVLDALLQRCLQLGARRARPGEFTERAYLEGRLDLAQAEAVADLIAASDSRSARAARRALDGVFSRQVEALAASMLTIRVHVEAAIDFVDEPLDTLGGEVLWARIDALCTDLDATLAQARRGQRLRDGLHAVLIGPPNAGKSSLLNALAGTDRAIVTDIPGTTRDLLQETVRIDGVELTLVDTAGLRVAADAIEHEGIRRAQAELQRADLAIVVLDARDPHTGMAAVNAAIVGVPAQLWVHNKTDLLGAWPDAGGNDGVYVSALSGQGLDALHARLKQLAQGGDAGEGAFTARARHVEALRLAQGHLADARAQLEAGMLDLSAEALRLGHQALGSITGAIGADELLGHIFSRFCIGK